MSRDQKRSILHKYPQSTPDSSYLRWSSFGRSSLHRTSAVLCVVASSSVPQAIVIVSSLIAEIIRVFCYNLSRRTRTTIYLFTRIENETNKKKRKKEIKTEQRQPCAYIYICIDVWFVWMRAISRQIFCYVIYNICAINVIFLKRARNQTRRLALPLANPFALGMRV